MKISPPIITAALILFIGCTSKDIAPWGFDTTSGTDGPGALDLNTTCDGTAALSAPVPSPTPPSSYAYKILPIRGTAPGASMVGAEATSGQAKLVSVGSSSTFCIEVDLVKGDNQIKLFGLNSNGCPGKLSQAYAVSYSGGGTSPDMGNTKPSNVGKGKTITSKPSPESGSLSSLNDGSTATSAKFSFSDYEVKEKCDNCAWVKIDLGKAYTVSTFRIRWASDANNDYGKCHTILTAKSTPAQDPDCTVNAGWTVTHTETAGIAVPKDITVQPVTARYVAFLMYENGASWPTETFKLAEFEVWGVDPGATTPPQPDRCQ